MLRFSPLLLALMYGLAMYWFSAWRTRKELEARSTVLMDPQLQPVLTRLARALDVPKVTVHVYEVEPVNGLAAPDGKVYLTRGMLQKFHDGEISAEELASVIAHELGHVALGHVRRRMIDFSGQNAMRSALGAVLSRIIPGLGALIADLLTRLMAAHLSRSDEYEADEYASALMVKAGFGLAPQVSLFTKLDQLAGVGGARAAWLMSHPKTKDRIARIEQHGRDWGIEG